MIRKVVLYPAKILRQPTSKVTEIDSKVINIIEDMIDTLKQEEGVGLAANQIGEPLSIMLIDTTPKDEDQGIKEIIINPVLKFAEGEIVHEEGCLSFPGLFVEVKRSNRVGISYLDKEGKEKEIELEGFPAIVFQHEFDHLNGITFIDRLKGLKKRIALEKYNKILREIEFQGA